MSYDSALSHRLSDDLYGVVQVTDFNKNGARLLCGPGIFRISANRCSSGLDLERTRALPQSPALCDMRPSVKLATACWRSDMRNHVEISAQSLAFVHDIGGNR